MTEREAERNQAEIDALDRTFLDWRDTSSLPLIVKVAEAAAAFEAKFEVKPNALILPLEDGSHLVGSVFLGMATRCSAFLLAGVIRVGVEVHVGEDRNE